MEEGEAQPALDPRAWGRSGVRTGQGEFFPQAIPADDR
jgi:hypothetical protein